MIKSYIHRYLAPAISEKTAATSLWTTQLPLIYNFPEGYNGTGQKIAFIELGGGFLQSDLNSYFQNLGVQCPTVQFVPVGDVSNSPTNVDADGEVMLDLCVTIGCVNNCSPIVYLAANTEQGFIDAINQAVSDKVNIISISWGAPEDQWSADGISGMNAAFQAAYAANITVCCASGDSGSSDGEDGTHVDFPSSSPYVLACGGTRLNMMNGNYITETVWNDQYGATGGGDSALFSVPAWQRPRTMGGRRGVPDVAGVADPMTGIKVIVDGTVYTFGGTSAVAPLWAGVVAIANQIIGKNLGLINPFLYSLLTTGPSSTAPFHDITVGNNGDFFARRGWDNCTGLGTPNVANLIFSLGRLPAVKNKV